MNDATVEHSAHVAAYMRLQHRKRLTELRDDFVQIASNGRFVSAAAKEWRELHSTWRMVLLMVAGVGVDTDDLGTLATRSWQEMPEPEQQAVRWAVRDAKKNVAALAALAARV